MNFQNCNPAQRSPALAEGAQVTAGRNDVLGAGQAAAFSDNKTIPKAYINYMFFDRNRQYKRGGFKQVSSAALNAFETLTLNFKPEEEGYMMIYVANQTNEDLDVHFDDLTVEHLEGPIIRTDDYYPFGLTFNSSERSGFTTNKFLYNGVELQEDLGLGLYQTLFRMYDPALGRFTQIDPLADFFPGINPYSFGYDNPILYGDPDGLGPIKDFFKKLFGRGQTKTDKNQRKCAWNNKTKKPKKKKQKKGKKSSSSPTPTPSDTEEESRNYYSYASIQSLGIDSDITEPNRPNIGPVPIPDNSQLPTPSILGREVTPANPVTIRLRIAFRSSSDIVSNYTLARDQLQNIADDLIKDPRLSVFVVGNIEITRSYANRAGLTTGNSNQALNQQMFMNGNLVPARSIMNARAQAVVNILIDLGVDPSQIDFGPGTIFDSVRGWRVTLEGRTKE
jgi:RHS repeat-associated protein